MKLKLHLFTLVLLLLVSLTGYGQISVDRNNVNTASATIQQDSQGYTDDAPDDNFFTGGLFVMTIFMLIGLCILAALGIAFAGIVLALIMALGFAGIVSSSLLVGLYQKSFEKGFKMLIILCAGFCGMLSGGIFFSVVNRIRHWTEFVYALSAGLLAGLIAGLITGYIAFEILRALTKSVAEKAKAK